MSSVFDPTYMFLVPHPALEEPEKAANEIRPGRVLSDHSPEIVHDTTLCAPLVPVRLDLLDVLLVGHAHGAGVGAETPEPEVKLQKSQFRGALFGSDRAVQFGQKEFGRFDESWIGRMQGGEDEVAVEQVVTLSFDV